MGGSRRRQQVRASFGLLLLSDALAWHRTPALVQDQALYLALCSAVYFMSRSHVAHQHKALDARQAGQTIWLLDQRGAEVWAALELTGHGSKKTNRASGKSGLRVESSSQTGRNMRHVNQLAYRRASVAVSSARRLQR